MKERLAKIKNEFEDLTDKLSNPKIAHDPRELQKISRRRAELARVISLAERLELLEKRLLESKELYDAETDHELKNMADEEIKRLTSEKDILEKELQLSLLPADPNDEKDVILEIRPAVGGDEAELFAADLFRMYSRYAENKGWRIEILNSNRTSIGGIKEIIFSVAGTEPYHFLKYESGVHRVQRVPKTEKSGRVHTSAATVAVLPEAEEVDVNINESDLKIDVYRSKGAGGQSVNTTDSAVRITHLPSGIVVACQDERSQLKNKLKALKILRSRLLVQKEEAAQKSRGDTRRLQIGTGDRSEKIRTYNFPQDRVTDHRIKQTVNNLQSILDGNLDQIVSPLISADQAKKMEYADPPTS